jgi:hypothetical protein
MRLKTFDHQSMYAVQYFCFLYNYAYIQIYNRLYMQSVLPAQIHFVSRFQQRNLLCPCMLLQGIQALKCQIQFRTGKFWRMMARINRGTESGIFFLKDFAVIFYQFHFFLL